MASPLLRLTLALVLTLVAAWLALVAFLVALRPKGLRSRDMLRLLPDTVRLLKRITTDPSLPRGLRMRLVLLLGYLALPFDLIPDFIPVVGHIDDVILILVALRSVVRQAGPEAVRRHWPGTSAGLAALWAAAGLPELPE